MSVSSVNSGLAPNQSALKSPLPQRTNTQAASPEAVSVGAGSTPSAQGSAAVNLGTTIPHGNRVGVAAYTAIMNPQAATSMRIEA